MAKTKITSSFLIGLFVLLGVMLFVLAVIWFGKDKISEEAKYYVTYFDSSVNGLTMGTAVKYQGIDCGSITQLSIAPDGKLIEVLMSINPNLKVTEDIRAQVAMSGIAGGKFVQLYYPKATSELVRYPKLTFPIDYPRIKSAPSEIDDIRVGAQDVMKNLTKIEYIKISEKLYALLDTLMTVADNSNRLITNKDLYLALGNLSASSAELTGILQKIDSLKIYRELETTAYNLDKMSANVLAISEKLDNKIDDIQIQTFLENIESQLDTTASTANAAINNISYQSVNAMYSLTEMIDELKRTNKDLQNTLRAFTEAPTHTLFSKEPPKDD